MEWLGNIFRNKKENPVVWGFSSNIIWRIIFLLGLYMAFLKLFSYMGNNHTFLLILSSNMTENITDE